MAATMLPPAGPVVGCNKTRTCTAAKQPAGFQSSLRACPLPSPGSGVPPPSVYSKIKFSDETLMKKLRTAPALGSNVKYMMQLDQRFWKDFGSSPTASEDRPVNLTWETTEDNDDGDGAFIFVAFSGAQAADTCVGWSVEDRRKNYVSSMSLLYPGLDAHLKDGGFMAAK
jgi:monoamine oxidase